MSEHQQELKKTDSFRATHLPLGIMCLVGVLLGLSEVLDNANESGSTIKLVLGVVMLVFGGIGAAIYGWLAIRNRT